jgi:glycosyltransferase involved in cell wall biosynthesis
MFSSNGVIHYHALGPSLFSFLPRLVGKKTVVTVQGLDWQRKKWGRLASLVLRLGERASVRFPNATMVVSRTLQDYYSQRHGADTRYVPNGTVVRQRSSPRQILEWGLTPDEYVLFLGRLSPEKNCHLLIEAFETLETRAKLVFAGGSSHTHTYAEKLRQHQSDRIVFLDWVAGGDLDELLTNAALFVLPSDLEGLSLALLDAMGAGLCVLTSDIVENREVVEDAGFTFRAGDVADLTRMLGLLLSDSKLRVAAGVKARQRIQERYLWPRIATEIGQVYDELAGKRTIPKKIPPAKISAERQTKQAGRVA